MTPSHATTFTIWQLPNQTHIQMMSYIIQTVNGKLIVIDGGETGDAPFLFQFIKTLGGHVDRWFLTHPHRDHINALGCILRDYPALTVKTISGSFCDSAWIRKYGTEKEFMYYNDFMHVLSASHRTMEELSLGDFIELDGVSIKVLGIKNPDITENPLNNSSLVLRVWDSNKSLLFLSDLGVEGGQKILDAPDANFLKCDYVQMAHHGQHGVSEAFYQFIKPEYCLWPTPDWLWNNDDGAGKDSGPWETLTVRKWIDSLHVKENICGFEGVFQIGEKGIHTHFSDLTAFEIETFSHSRSD